MISLDQVLLLQQKVESAVAKIAELNQTVAQKEAENAALRSKCVELTNALSAKTEQFSSFQTDQTKIEEGILKALERLNAVESTVLSVAAQANHAPAANAGVTTQAAQVVPQPASTPQDVAEQAVSPDMTVEQALEASPVQLAAAENAETLTEASDADAEAAFDEDAITPDISFDDATPSPEQPDDSSQGQFEIF